MNKNACTPMIVSAAALLGVFVGPARATYVVPQLPTIPAKIFDVVQHGIVADGKTDNFKALQALIDSVSQTGGGVIDFPAASNPYISAPFVLRNHIDFRVESGAKVEPLAYGVYKDTGGTRYPDWLTTTGAQDIALSGHGTIDGNGSAWWSAFNANGSMPHRPYLINLKYSKRIHVHGLTLQNSPMEHLVLSSDSEVTVDTVTILCSSSSPNTDGIDPSGVDFLITNDSISDGDDDIAVKPYVAFCRNITITHVRCGAGHGISIGGQTTLGLDSMLVDSCTLTGTTNGLRLKSNRSNGALVENLVYENITMRGVKNAFLITSYYQASGTPATDPAQPVTATTPIWKNILFKNITSTGASSSVEMYGLPEAPVNGIAFQNVTFTGASKGFVMDHVHGLYITGTTYNGSSSLSSMISSEVDVTMGTTGLANRPMVAPFARGLRVDPLGRPLGASWNGLHIGLEVHGTGSATESVQVP
jgi:polygalacturonase